MAERCNNLTGSEWVKSSISIWDGLRFSKDEKKLEHPAKFPQALVGRLIDCFMSDRDKVVMDPFCGSGTTLAAAYAKGKHGVGFELSAPYFDLTLKRMVNLGAVDGEDFTLICGSAEQVGSYHRIKHVPDVDLVITSPPYWNILSRKRSADQKAIRDYTGPDVPGNLGKVQDYDEYLDSLVEILFGVQRVMRPGAYLVLNVMDIRVGPKLYTLHTHLMSQLTLDGTFEFDDMIIWDRRMDYNNLRALGYPARFRLNRCHEFLLIFRKPKPQPETSVRRGNRNAKVQQEARPEAG